MLDVCWTFAGSCEHPIRATSCVDFRTPAYKPTPVNIIAFVVAKPVASYDPLQIHCAEFLTSYVPSAKFYRRSEKHSSSRDLNDNDFLIIFAQNALMPMRIIAVYSHFANLFAINVCFATYEYLNAQVHPTKISYILRRSLRQKRWLVKWIDIEFFFIYTWLEPELTFERLRPWKIGKYNRFSISVNVKNVQTVCHTGSFSACVTANIYLVREYLTGWNMLFFEHSVNLSNWLKLRLHKFLYKCWLDSRAYWDGNFGRLQKICVLSHIARASLYWLVGTSLSPVSSYSSAFRLHCSLPSCALTILRGTERSETFFGKPSNVYSQV